MAGLIPVPLGVRAPGGDPVSCIRCGGRSGTGIERCGDSALRLHLPGWRSGDGAFRRLPGPRYTRWSRTDRTRPLDTALRVPNLTAHAGVGEEDVDRRLAALETMNRGFLRDHDSEVAASRSTAAHAASRLMRPHTAQAFDLERESESIRSTYGHNLFGQGCLLARWLVERGVPFVEVSLDGWDTHSNNFDLVQGLSSTVDIAFSALLADLQNRGMLDSTLVVWMGEFCCTPRINGRTGRDHWANAFSTVLAGGGVRGGQIYGRRTAKTARPSRIGPFASPICWRDALPRRRRRSDQAEPV